MELLAALRDPEHPEHAEYREWVGPLYEPERFDPWQAGRNLMLAMAGGGVGGRASSGACTGGARGAWDAARGSDRSLVPVEDEVCPHRSTGCLLVRVL
jgi:hypothetical protein